MSKRTKSKKKLTEPSATEVKKNLRKSEAILLRLTLADKETIQAAAEDAGITKTEFITKSALMVANKMGK